MMTNRDHRTVFPALLPGLALLAAGAATAGQAQPAPAGEDVPQFRVDPFWARELPDNWMLGQVSGIDVNADDHVWVLHRPRTLDARQRGEVGMCCVLAPPVIELDPDGNVLRSWGGLAEGYELPSRSRRRYRAGHRRASGSGPGDCIAARPAHQRAAGRRVHVRFVR